MVAAELERDAQRRNEVETLRAGLGHLPGEDGRPVLDRMRRIRGEVASVEEEMQEQEPQRSTDAAPPPAC